MATEPANILTGVADRHAFRSWLELHRADEPECWVAVRRGRPTGENAFWYLDAVEEALCFGWIDSTHKEIGGVRMQRFTPRKSNSPWTELNKERVRRLEALGLMTDAGRVVLPPMGPRSFRVDPDVMAALKAARCWSKFKQFPPLYQRIRAYNVAFYKRRDPEAYERALANLIAHTKRGEMFGEWNDYGRLHDYGNFEKVGPLPMSLPTNDTQITTEPGDVILYQGNQITIYYDTNTWEFTRLGKIEGATTESLLAVLGEGDVEATLSL